MRRFFLNDTGLRLPMVERPDGTWVRLSDVAPLIAAVDKLLAAKGRFHTEQNYRALADARTEMEKK